MDDFTFRTPIESEPEAPTPSVREPGSGEAPQDSEIEPTYLEYEGVNDRPFISDYFQVGAVYEELPPETKARLRTIDAYVGKKIKSREFIDSTDSAKAILSDLEKRANVAEFQDSYKKIDMLAEFLDVLDPKRAIKRDFASMKDTVLTVLGTEKKAKAIERELKQAQATLGKSEEERKAAEKQLINFKEAQKTEKEAMERRLLEEREVTKSLQKSSRESEIQVLDLTKQLEAISNQSTQEREAYENALHRERERSSRLSHQYVSRKTAIKQILETL